MLREGVRAAFLLALGPVAARLGVAMLPAEAVARDAAHRGEMVRDMKDLSNDLAEAHQAAIVWEAAATSYRVELARVGGEMAVTVGNDDEGAEGQVP